MTRLFRALHLTPLASAAILTCICVSSFSIASHAGHIGASLVGVASAATLEAPTAAPVDPLPWLAYVGLALAAAGGLLKILDVLIAGLKWLAPRTETTIDDTARDDLQIVRDDIGVVLKLVGGLIPATGVPTASSLVATAPSKSPQGGFARVDLMTIVAGLVLGVAIGACAAIKTEAVAIADGVVTCAKADKAAVQALGLQLGTEAIAGFITTGSVPWDRLKADAEAAGKAQGIEIAACAFGGLLADLDRLLHPIPAPTVSALIDLEGDPLDGGRATFRSFTAAHGITRVDP